MLFLVVFDDDCGCSDPLLNLWPSEVFYFQGLNSFTKEMQNIILLFLSHYWSITIIFESED